MFAVIYIPDFLLQAVLRHEPDLRERAVALVISQLHKPVVIQFTSAARSCGVCEGLTASQALARCTELIIKSRSPAQEESATEVLLQTACAFSPNIESTAPGVCTLELRGLPFQCNRDAAEPWAQKIIEVLAQFYLEARIGFATTPELALLAARAAEPILFLQNGKPDSDSHAARVESFPVSSLELTPEMSAVLQRWGIRTVGELLALGKDAIAERFGPPAMDLFDRVSPDSARPLRLVTPPQEFAEHIDFEHEIETAEPLLFVLRRFTEQLSRRLELIYLVVAELHLQLGLGSVAKYERIFKIPAPTGNIEVLFRMLQTHLETVRTDSPIVSLRLAAKAAQPEAQQFGLFESTLRDPNQFAETMAQLTALVGSENIGTPKLIDSHKPDSFHMVAPEFGCQSPGSLRDFPGRSGNPPKRSRIEPLNCSSGRESALNFSLRKVEPTHVGCYQVSEKGIGLRFRRFRPALASYIEFRGGKPSLLRSPVFVGAIVEIRGPFHSSGNWWDTGRWTREEWDVEASDGSLFRIFCSAEGCFLEGVYD